MVFNAAMTSSALMPPMTCLALDAALSSPAGLGVAVDARKQVIGGIKADDVIAALKTKRGTT